MAKEKISRSEYLQLLGLEILVRKHNAVVDDLRRAISEVLGVDHPDDEVSDFVWADRSVDELLNSCGVTLEGADVEVADANT